METFSERFGRLLLGSPNEYASTLLNGLSISLLPQIEEARKTEAFSLVFLGTHAAIQIVTEKILGVTEPIDGTREFLERFVDANEPDKRFSTITDDIHFLRNVIAHSWLSHRAHKLVFHDSMPEGWRKDGDDLLINRNIYTDQFKAAFGSGGRIWEIRKWIDPELALNQKYLYLRSWLELPKSDAISIAVKEFVAAPVAGRAAAEQKVQELIKARYGLP